MCMCAGRSRNEEYQMKLQPENFIAFEIRVKTLAYT